MQNVLRNADRRNPGATAFRVEWHDLQHEFASYPIEWGATAKTCVGWRGTATTAATGSPT